MSDDTPTHAPASWRRKTEDERRRDLRRANPHKPGPSLFAAAVCVGIVMVFGMAIWPTDIWGRALPSIVPLAITIGVLSYLIAYGVQETSARSRRARPLLGICNQCFALTLDASLDRCPCGGAFEDANGWMLNRCPHCAYDLRATTDRCPECGHELRFYVIPGPPPSRSC